MLAKWLVSHPRQSLGIFVVLTLLLAGFGFPKLQYVADVDSTLPQHSNVANSFRLVRSIFGSDDTAAFTISGGTLPERIEASCRLSENLARDANVAGRSVSGAGSLSSSVVRNDAGSMVVEPSIVLCGRQDLTVAELQRLLGDEAQYLVGNGHSLHVFADLKIDAGAYVALKERVDRYLEEIANDIPAVSLTSTGPPSFWAALQIYSERIGLFFPIIMVVIGLLHYEALRSVQAAVLPLVAGLLATVLTLSCMGLAGIPLDEFSSTAPILILAVAAGHSVQLLKRFMEELRARAGDGAVTADQNRDALVATLIAMAPVLATAVVAATLCLFALTLMDIEAIGRFGLVAGIGLLFALLIELSVMPALRALRPPKTLPERFGEMSALWRRLLDLMCHLALRAKPLATVVAGLVLLAMLFGGIQKIRVTASVLEPFATDIPERQALDALTAQGVGGFPLDVVIDTKVADGAFDPAVLKQALAVEQLLKSDGNVAAVTSAVSVLRFLKCRFMDAADCTSVQVERSEEADQLWTIFSGAGDTYPLLDEDRRFLRIRAFLFDGGSGTVSPLIERLRALPNGESLLLGGPAVLGKAIGDGIVSMANHKVAVILLISGLVGLVVFRSMVAAVLFLIPSAVSAGAGYAFLGWTDTSLNVATASIAALAVGVGADYLVYFTFRLREQLSKGTSWEQALDYTYQSAGGASLCVATAVAGGYMVLLLSRDFLIHRWLGQLIPLAVMGGVFATLVIYPALLNLLRPAFLWARK